MQSAQHADAFDRVHSQSRSKVLMEIATAVTLDAANATEGDEKCNDREGDLI
jgi:hypothetical protein